MKRLLILPLAIAALSGVAYANQASQQSAPGSVACRSYSGTVLRDCFNRVETTTTQPARHLKLIKPVPPNNGGRGEAASGHGVRS